MPDYFFYENSTNKAINYPMHKLDGEAYEARTHRQYPITNTHHCQNFTGLAKIAFSIQCNGIRPKDQHQQILSAFRKNVTRKAVLVKIPYLCSTFMILRNNVDISRSA